jgi:hypothetical protein
MLVQRTSPRELLTRWIQQMPDDWLVELLPVLIRLVVVVRRFFAAASDPAGGVGIRVPTGATAVGIGTAGHAANAQ